MANVVPDYCIENPIERQFWGRGANDTYKIICSDTCYFLRVYRRDTYPLEAVEFEAEFLAYLQQQGFPVAYPIPRKSGGFITKIEAFEGPRWVLVTALAEGDEVDYGSLEHCYWVGQSIAQLHQLADGFTSSRQRQHLDLDGLLERSLSSIRHYLKRMPEKMHVIEKVAKNAREAIESVPEECLDIGVCHGDFHGGNLHLNNKDVIQFDFEECAIGYRLYGLGTFKWDLCETGSRAERWEAFIKGYQSIRVISEASFALVDHFVVVREIAEVAYGIRHIQYFGCNDIMAANIDQVCEKLIQYLPKAIEI